MIEWVETSCVVSISWKSSLKFYKIDWLVMPTKYMQPLLIYVVGHYKILKGARKYDVLYKGMTNQ